MKRLILATVLAAALGACGQTTVFTPDKSDAFARIETGISTAASRERVVELMGTPGEQSYRDLLGISHERLTFKDGKRAYTVTLINGVAISKSVENLTQGETP